MIYGAELCFDPVMESKILDIWNELRDTGITSSMFDVGSRPHVTLAVWETADVPSLQAAVADFCRQTLPLPVRLTNVGSFITSPGVVFLAPLVTRELLDFHAGFHHFLSDFPATSYVPDGWEPHCTMAIDLTPEKVAQTVEVCKSGRVWIGGCFTRIALGQYPPTQYLAEFELTGK